ncbi:MAG: hypothetical protein JW932_16345 [Deltaproteobacteria bacterium]|nr:hypothetical protein [Deltaproteobacteria bacterium]
MIFFIEFVTAFAVAFVLVLLFTWITRKQKRKEGLIWVFIMLFFATWAGGVWLAPFGPTLWGAHWLAFIVVGITLLLILVVSLPPKAPRGRHETLDMLERFEHEKEMERFTYITMGTLFWILLGVLIIALLVRYIRG